MSEADVISRSSAPVTRERLVSDLRALGVREGDLLNVHASLSALGWVVGGARTVVDALLDVLGDTGTLSMPAHTSDNGDPARWENPPVPEEWWPVIRSHMPAFDPAVSTSRGMGAVAECLRTWPGTLRSDHPRHSHLARGPLAADIVTTHRLEGSFADDSPLGRLVAHGGRVLLLGVGHDANSVLHVAEHRAAPGVVPVIRQGTAMWVDGVRTWVWFDELDHDSEDFPAIGADIETRGLQRRGPVGEGVGLLMDATDAVTVAAEHVARRSR